MVDSHALVGSCAQIGKRGASERGRPNWWRAGASINASPVVIEDDVLIGGNCGVYEGTLVRTRAVLGAGTILTRSTPLYDLVRGEVYRATEDHALEVPENAVVVPGSRAVKKGKGEEWNLSLYYAGDREVSRREDRSGDGVGRVAALDPDTSFV